jgi:hypothetical protein
MGRYIAAVPALVCAVPSLRMARIVLFVVVLMSSHVRADSAACLPEAISAAAQKGLVKAARRDVIEPLNLATLYYCSHENLARATVDTVLVPQADGSESGSTLTCSTGKDQPRDWICQVDRYDVIHVATGEGQPQVAVALANRASLEITRARAAQAFALLNETGQVKACPGTLRGVQSNESLRAILARGHGPYRLVISREGFALLRGAMQIRFRLGAPATTSARVECWNEAAVEQ